MSKLDRILHGHANWAHRWDKNNPTTYIYGTGISTETVATKQAIKNLMLEIITETDFAYKDASAYAGVLKKKIEKL